VFTGQVADKDVVGVNFSQLVLKVLSTQFTFFISTTVQILAPKVVLKVLSLSSSMRGASALLALLVDYVLC
jgi:hypothetical protein